MNGINDIWKKGYMEYRIFALLESVVSKVNDWRMNSGNMTDNGLHLTAMQVRCCSVLSSYYDE